MKTYLGMIAAAGGFALAGCGPAEERATAPASEISVAAPKPDYEPMAHFAPLAGKAWRGEGTGPDGKPIVDIARYEMILGGRAFQATHRLEGGSYGGRTIIFFDEGAKKHIFHYFTTAGFHTTGEIKPTPTGFISIEKVQGHADIAEVRAEAFFEGDVIRIASTHVAIDGAASAGDELVYRAIDDPGPLY